MANGAVEATRPASALPFVPTVLPTRALVRVPNDIRSMAFAKKLTLVTEKSASVLRGGWGPPRGSSGGFNHGLLQQAGRSGKGIRFAAVPSAGRFVMARVGGLAVALGIGLAATTSQGLAQSSTMFATSESDNPANPHLKPTGIQRHSPQTERHTGSASADASVPGPARVLGKLRQLGSFGHESDAPSATSMNPGAENHDIGQVEGGSRRAEPHFREKQAHRKEGDRRPVA